MLAYSCCSSATVICDHVDCNVLVPRAFQQCEVAPVRRCGASLHISDPSSQAPHAPGSGSSRHHEPTQVSEIYSETRARPAHSACPLWQQSYTSATPPSPSPSTRSIKTRAITNAVHLCHDVSAVLVHACARSSAWCHTAHPAAQDAPPSNRAARLLCRRHHRC